MDGLELFHTIPHAALVYLPAYEQTIKEVSRYNELIREIRVRHFNDIGSRSKKVAASLQELISYTSLWGLFAFGLTL